MFRNILGGLISILFFVVVACSDDNPSVSLVEPIADESSSSVDALSSDGVVVESSSSGAGKARRYNLWDPAVDYKVKTGDDSTGFWRTFGDTLFGQQGKSKIVFPVELEKSSTPLASVFKHCDGLCGSLEPDTSVYRPWAGFEIQLARDGATADVSSWGGICITYESDYWMYVHLKVNVDGIDSKSEIWPFMAYPEGFLERTTHGGSEPTLRNLYWIDEPKTVCAEWSRFDITRWKYSEYSINRQVYTGEEAAKEILSIMFEVKSQGDDDKKTFNIRGISTYKPDEFSFDWEFPNDGVNVDFPDDDSLTCLWKGVDGTHVKTGYNDRDRYAGWLEHFEASPGDAYAHIEFPVELSGEFGYEVYGGLIEECLGFCGTMDFTLEGAEYAVGGVSFNIAGFNDGDYVFEDIQDWGGVCVTYFSEKDAYLNFVIKDVPYENSPKVALPKSSRLVEKCFTWNEIAPNDPDMGRAVGAIQFAIKGTVDQEQCRFNLAGIGKYSANGACSFETREITSK